MNVKQLYADFAVDIFRYALSLLKNKEEAEDAVQEVFAKCIESSGSFKGNCSAKTWLLTITRNFCYNRLKSKNYNTTGLDESFDLPDFHDEDASMTLEDALARLSERQRELLFLKEYEGYSYKEIGELTSLSVENIKIILYRTRQYLRTYLKDVS